MIQYLHEVEVEHQNKEEAKTKGCFHATVLWRWARVGFLNTAAAVGLARSQSGRSERRLRRSASSYWITELTLIQARSRSLLKPARKIFLGGKQNTGFSDHSDFQRTRPPSYLVWWYSSTPLRVHDKRSEGAGDNTLHILMYWHTRGEPTCKAKQNKSCPCHASTGNNPIRLEFKKPKPSGTLRICDQSWVHVS